MEDVLEVYHLPYDPRYPVVCMDESSKQLMGEVREPVPCAPGRIARMDDEYVRNGVAEIFMEVEPLSGKRHVAITERRTRKDWAQQIKEMLDEHYPPEAIIRVVLDNHSAPISKETMAYLATRPRRFEYVHTPKHGSWLNLIECAFSKMARTFLRHIRVGSIDELKTRIPKGIDEINASPVVFRWNKFDLGVD
ncbi:hypothetical protein GALLN_00508 [Gallionellaceae bacterium]|nr:hypothetical protein GALLN_00508 [Gallionellaceae bacterium]